MLLNCTHRNDLNDTFYVLHIFFTIKKSCTHKHPHCLSLAQDTVQKPQVIHKPLRIQSQYLSPCQYTFSSAQSYSAMLELGSHHFVSLYTDHSHRQPDHLFSICNIFHFHPFLVSLITIRDKSCLQPPVCFSVSLPTSLQFYKKKVSSHLELYLWCLAHINIQSILLII